MIAVGVAGEASVSAALGRATLRAVVGGSTKSASATAGTSSAAVASLAEDVSRSLIMTKARSIALAFTVACGTSLAVGGSLQAVAPPRELALAAPTPDGPEEPKDFLGRMKDYRFATVGNMRPTIDVGKGPQFQSRTAILYADGSVRLYPFALDPAEKVAPVVPTIRHAGPIRELTIVDELGLLITGSDDSVKLWDALNGAARRTIGGQFMRPLGFATVGGRFATIDTAGRVVTVWDAKTLEPVGSITPEGSTRLIGAGLSKDGRTLATIAEDRSVTLRDSSDGKPFATLRAPSPPVARVFEAWPTSTDRPPLPLDGPFWDAVKSVLPADEPSGK